MTVAGASRFLVSSTLANEQGIGAGRPQLLGGVDLLEAGRRINRSSIGLSSSARSLNRQFVNQVGSQGAALFGMTSGAALSVADLAQQIKALRSSLPKDKISPLVLAAEEAKIEEDAKAAAASLRKQAEQLVQNERGVSLKEYEKRLEEQIRILEAKQGKDSGPTHTSFRRGLTLNEQA
ncbi:MAG: hypothetical protein LRZ85_04020 [Alphaproteobacteria bacterium]|nr:hypothetical protein [Alphaproteobacteria bacterium]MCD8520374.1 hypothetical protein [Alphaproteobacteria bacterium]MCD8526301.1 hypothetical protein [Alphaproteobacteria bacterium]MCD8570062.1 hypothetical protein [Alphaproteobacteria bacterium]